MITAIMKETKNLHVLFVEDNEDIRISILLLLESFFDNIVIAIDGEDGFNKYLQSKDKPFDLIITDLKMPKLDGLEMSKKIRNLDEFIPILVLTAFSEHQYLLDSIDIGVDGYLNKPLDVDKFIFYMKRILKNINNKSAKDFTDKHLLKTIDENVILTKTDLRGVILYASHAFCKISGYSNVELVGHAHNMLRHPDMPCETFANMWKQLEEKKDWKGELKNLKKDGSSYWVYAEVTPNIDFDGKHIGYTSISRDIAMLKEIERLNESLEIKIKESNKELKAIVKHSRESIEYAALIQSALIPDNELFRKYFKEYFVIWHPKDVVGGDIYLFEELRHDDECLLMVIDCTGHGVPGAFVTMLVKAIERQIVSQIINSDEEVSPANLLSVFNKTMKNLLKQEDNSSISNAGFDGQIMYYNKKDKIVKIASARNEIFYYQDDKLHTLKGDRHSVGYKDSDADYEFSEHIIDVSKETTMYISSDGFWDQNGGEKDLPYGKKRLKRMLDEIYMESMADQQEEFIYQFEDYRNGSEKNDDVTVIGIKI